MTDYRVEATHHGGFWHVDVPAINRVTQARHARDVPEMARSLIEIMTQEENAPVEISYVLPTAAQQHLANATQLRAAEAETRRAAAMEMRLAASVLKAEGLSLRDIGAVLGVSFQRAGQLVKG